MAAIATFVVGLAVHLMLEVSNIASGLSFILNILAFIVLILALTAGAKTFGGLATGITSLIAGAVIWFVGMTIKEYPEPSYIIGVEFPPFSDPLYIMGWAILYYGAIMFIVGHIMAVVTYLWRVWKAVEGRPHVESSPSS